MAKRKTKSETKSNPFDEALDLAMRSAIRNEFVFVNLDKTDWSFSERVATTFFGKSNFNKVKNPYYSPVDNDPIEPKEWGVGRTVFIPEIRDTEEPEQPEEKPEEKPAKQPIETQKG